MFERSKFTISLLVLVLLAGAVSQADAADNIVGDFSPSSNPTGNWSYGFTSTLGGTFNLFTTSTTQVPPNQLPCDGTVMFWTTPSGFPLVGHNPSGMTVTCSSTVSVPNDVLTMHPGPSGAQAVVRWTAPASGTYAIQGFFEGLDFVGPTTTDVHILLNSSTSLFSGNISSFEVPLTFTLSLSVSAGDKIDFVVGFGSDGNYLFDSTGLKGTITLLLGGGSNLALGKTATQSSTIAGYATAGASSAVDGNLDGNFFDGSVTATNADLNAWWQVDLGASAVVSSVVVFNRTDCCASRLNDFWVFISDTPFLPTDTPTTLQNRAGTFSSHQTSPPNPSTTLAAAAQGRYVRVQLSGTNYLSLAEVQVFGTGGAPAPTNVALGKSASQSSTLPGYSTDGAAVAVDGNTDGSFPDGSVTATNLDPTPWWQVDLGASAAVSSIVVWNRTDCCSSRLGDYWVFVSDTPFLATDSPATLQSRAGTFSSHQTTAPNPSTIIAAAAQGRYVRVQLSSAGYLSLAEVQVFGQ